MILKLKKLTVEFKYSKFKILSIIKQNKTLNKNTLIFIMIMKYTRKHLWVWNILKTYKEQNKLYYLYIFINVVKFLKLSTRLRYNH